MTSALAAHAVYGTKYPALLQLADLSEWPPKNSNPYSPIFGPHFPVGPKMDPGQCIEVFQAKKTGLGVHRAHSVEFFVKE